MRTFRLSVMIFSVLAAAYGCVNTPPPATPTVPDSPPPPTPPTQINFDAGPQGNPATTADSGTSKSSDGGACVQQVMCVTGQHFDQTQCKCVANNPAASTDGGKVCAQVVMCMTNMHFDTTVCKCVKN